MNNNDNMNNMNKTLPALVIIQEFGSQDLLQIELVGAHL